MILMASPTSKESQKPRDFQDNPPEYQPVIPLILPTKKDQQKAKSIIYLL